MHIPRYAARVRWDGDEIRRRRKLAGFESQQQLADAIGASRRAVADWELDNSRPQGRNMDALERVLGDPAPPNPAPQEPDPGPLLADATFTQTLNHLIDLHNEALRGGLHRVLRVEDVAPPPDLPEHDVAAGPSLDQVDGPGLGGNGPSTSATRTSDGTSN